MRGGALGTLDLVEIPLDVDDQLVHPCVEAVGVGLLPRDLPGDLLLGLVH